MSTTDPPPERPGQARDPRLPVADDRTPVRAADMSELVHRLRAISDHLWERDEALRALREEVEALVAANRASHETLARTLAQGLDAVADQLDAVASQGDLRGQLVVAKVQEHHAVVVAKVDGIAATTAAKLEAIEKHRPSGGVPWPVFGVMVMLTVSGWAAYMLAHGDDPRDAFRLGKEAAGVAVPGLPSSEAAEPPEVPHEP